MDQNSTLNYTDNLPQDLAYAELNPKNNKPPRKIPFLKIIIYTLIILISLTIIFIFFNLIKKQKVPKLNEVSKISITQIPISPAPEPTKNPCGYEANLCPDGTLIEKTGFKCEFKTCEDASMDMRKFWKVTTNENYRNYENLDLSYSFQGPILWRFVGRDVGVNFFSPNYKCKKQDSDCTGANILLLTSVTTGKTDVSEWLKSKENYVFPNITKNIDSLPIINISGKKAIKIKDTGSSESYVFIYNDTVFILSYGASNSTDANKAKKVFNQIISSFKTSLN